MSVATRVRDDVAVLCKLWHERNDTRSSSEALIRRSCFLKNVKPQISHELKLRVSSCTVLWLWPFDVFEFCKKLTKLSHIVDLSKYIAPIRRCRN